MSDVSNDHLTDEQGQLGELAAIARTEHLAVGQALGNALQHAMNAGDALLALRKLVSAGLWEKYIRTFTGISERTARVYQRVAKARPQLERQSSAGPLSIAEALKLLQEPKQPRATVTKAKTNSAKEFDPARWWETASLEARQRFLDRVGTIGLLTALPPTMCSEIVRRVSRNSNSAPSYPGHLKASEIMRRALSLTKTASDTPGITPIVAASNEKEAVQCLRKLNVILADFSIDEITIVRQHLKAQRRAA
jgi:hypothetical protein